jgi:hypothetical protein
MDGLKPVPFKLHERLSKRVAIETVPSPAEARRIRLLIFVGECPLFQWGCNEYAVEVFRQSRHLGNEDPY